MIYFMGLKATDPNDSLSCSIMEIRICLSMGLSEWMGRLGNMCRIGPMLEKIGEPDDVKVLKPWAIFLRLIFELLLSQ